MGKYYKVYLEYQNFCMVCERVPFTKNLYREIISGKIIYPENIFTKGKLTYDYRTRGYNKRPTGPRCYEITNVQAKEWLLELKQELYISMLEEIEAELRKSIQEEIDKKRNSKQQEQEAKKTIKRLLKKYE